jgi:hypothetical protein
MTTLEGPVTAGQLDLFAGAYAPVATARPRPAVPHPTYAPEFFHVLPDQWALCVYALIPKLGTEHQHFPHYFGGPAEHPRWRVARQGELPGDTFLFGSFTEAQQITTEVFGGATDLGRFMTYIEIPSTDYRRQHRLA